VRLLREIYEAGTHDLAYSSGDVILVEFAKEGTFWLPFADRYSAWFVKLLIARGESILAFPGQPICDGWQQYSRANTLRGAHKAQNKATATDSSRALGSVILVLNSRRSKPNHNLANGTLVRGQQQEIQVGRYPMESLWEVQLREQLGRRPEDVVP
jgi:hypothetical protein